MKFRYLFMNPKWYLIGIRQESGNFVQMLHHQFGLNLKWVETR